MTKIEHVLAAREIVVYDTEFTSWPGSFERDWSAPGEHREIVQIGAVRLDQDCREVASFSELVTPKINPVLSEYFTKLTGITNADLDAHGQSLSSALRKFAEFCAGAEFVCAFGVDREVIQENCNLIGLKNPLSSINLVNVRPSLCEIAGVGESKIFSSEIPVAFGLEPQPDIHNGLSDARAVSSVLRHMKDRRTLQRQ